MAVDNSAALDGQTRAITQKRNELENEKNQLELDRARAAKDREQLIAKDHEQTDKQLVEISKAAENQMDQLKKLNSGRVHSLNENTEKNYQELAGQTADQIRRLNADALKSVEDNKAANAERIRSVTQRSEDPFYRIKTLSPVLSESDKDYTIRISVAEAEAKNIFVAGEGPYVKLALSRRYQDSANAPEGGRVTRTNSYQSIVEQVAMPGPYEAKKISREYQDGVLTIRIPKLNWNAPTEGKA